MNKIEVNGDNVDPVYKFLKERKSGLLGLNRIKWNFEKYTFLLGHVRRITDHNRFLLDRDGNVVQR